MALPFETGTQFAALALTLVGGWFLGLASRSGGAKWRERYQDEELEHARYRDEAESRIRTLERELKTSRSDAPAPVVADEPGGAWRGWFGWGRDNLARIKGVDEAREKRLNELGIKTYREIEKLAPADEAALEQRLGAEPGTIGEQGWREQAALLRAGNEREHAERFG
jgi:predicted flap endonuclease-1-like 5' DNA nuclease